MEAQPGSPGPPRPLYGKVFSQLASSLCVSFVLFLSVWISFCKCAQNLWECVDGLHGCTKRSQAGYLGRHSFVWTSLCPRTTSVWKLISPVSVYRSAWWSQNLNSVDICVGCSQHLSSVDRQAGSLYPWNSLFLLS